MVGICFESFRVRRAWWKRKGVTGVCIFSTLLLVVAKASTVCDLLAKILRLCLVTVLNLGVYVRREMVLPSFRSTGCTSVCPGMIVSGCAVWSQRRKDGERKSMASRSKYECDNTDYCIISDMDIHGCEARS